VHGDRARRRVGVGHGRGTDTRSGDGGSAIRKPVAATKDLRFFDAVGAPLLPDGHARRGMSVVAALSEWLVHTNRRSDGAWTQRYEHGIPVSDLVPVERAGAGSGTTVHFLPTQSVSGRPVSVTDLRRFARWPGLAVAVVEDLG
jgi:topoisomerase-4 subunit B